MAGFPLRLPLEPADRDLAARLVAVMEDPSVEAGDTVLDDQPWGTDERWEFALHLLAAVKLAGWSATQPEPPVQNPSP